MACRTSRFRLASICLASLLSITLTGLPESSLAGEANQTREGLPGRRVGGGTRGDCNFGEKTLIALIPQNNLGLTAAANPQLFFYMPPTSEPPTVEFVMRDEADRNIYESTFTTTKSSGIIALSLPDSAGTKSLEVGKKYHWYFSIICNAEDRSQDISVDGWIQRVEPSPTLASQLKNLAPQEKAKVYATHKLWHEALTTLMQLRQSSPQDSTLAATWEQMLQSVNLGNLAQEPFIANFPLAHTAPNKLDVGMTGSGSMPTEPDAKPQL